MSFNKFSWLNHGENEDDDKNYSLSKQRCTRSTEVRMLKPYSFHS